MLDQSLFTTHEIEQHEIELPDGNTHRFNFKPLNAADYSLTLVAFMGDDMDARAHAFTRAIAKSLCDDDGKPTITYEQAATLKPEVFNRLWDTVFKMNYLNSVEEDESKS